MDKYPRAAGGRQPTAGAARRSVTRLIRGQWKSARRPCYHCSLSANGAKVEQQSDNGDHDHARRFVARGVAHVDVPQPGEPIRISFILLPKFTMLAFTAAIEPLRAANQLAGKLLFQWQVFSADGAPVASSSGVPVGVDGAIPKEAPPGYVMVCGGVEPEVELLPGLADWIRAQWRKGRTVGGMCTGSYTLARAGILQGKRFTLHWENIPGFREAFPGLDPVHRVYCIEDRVVTCAGGVASADLFLKLIHDHAGPVLSQAVMDMCLLIQRRSGEDEQMTSLASRLGTRNPHVIKALSWLESHIEDDFDIGTCAAHVGITVRQLQRVFRQFLGATPVQCLNDMRLKRGRALLAETNMPVTEVAMACGYVSASHFSKSFRKKYGVTPHKFAHF